MIVPTSSPPDSLTPKHVRAARALLAWSQQDLAKNAGVATSTVADFERGHRTPVANNAQAIRGALENAGIRFLPTGAVVGPPIPRFASSDRPGAPLRWVDAADLGAWADRVDGIASLPTLVANLIHATHGGVIEARFPSDEGVLHPGWDGRTMAQGSSRYVPEGVAGWEIGSQRRAITEKATKDYRNRTANPSPLDPATSTFVFVTPRHWSSKAEWVQARHTEGAWRDVRAYDADDLVHWIELTPAVGQWLATRLNKRPPGTRELEEVWKEWSLATRWPLTEELVLCDRDADAIEVLRWLRAEPSVLSIQATTTAEAIAFFHATLAMLPDDAATHYRARCLIATEADSARLLANAPPPLIIVLAEPDPGLAHSLAERGHFVLQAYDDRPISGGPFRRLARPSREGIADALMDAGIPEARARTLARDSARNLAILRRRIPSAPGRQPDWAALPPPQALLAALLAGGWDDKSEADKATLAGLADMPYDAVVDALNPYIGDLDKPLRKIGSTWHVASPNDAWLLLGDHLTATHIGRFVAVASEVLGSPDPRFDLDPDERWMAPVHGVRPKYSGLLRHGVGEVLILLALLGKAVKTMPDADRQAGAIVRKLLQKADERRWWSLSRDFSLLAEAAPDAFLTAVEDSLDQNDPPISILFGADGDSVFGREHLSGLLWALEGLAWSPDLLPRVSLILARLDAIDPGGKFSNRPSNSLRHIHLLWAPQTHATLDERLRALDLVRRRETKAAWKLMLGILPRGHDTLTPSHQPRWRDFTADKPEEVTWPLVSRGATAIREKLLTDASLSIPRWLDLLDRLRDFSPDRTVAIERLEQVAKQIKFEADRAALWSGIRKCLHHNRQFIDAEWALPVEELARLEAIYHHLAPANPLEQVAWLFESAVALPNPSREGWEAESRQLDEERQNAARFLHAKAGAAGILALAKLIPTAGFIGKALAEAGLDEESLQEVLEASLKSDDERQRNVAHGLIISTFRERAEPWAAALIEKVHTENWGDTPLLTILRALPPRPWTWAQAAAAGEAIDRAYWLGAPVLWLEGDAEGVTYAMRKLIAVGRARDAVHLAGRDRDNLIPSDLLVNVLTQAVQQPFERDRDGNEATMFQYYVAEILQHLDDRTDVAEDTLVGLEWMYLGVLEHSRRPPKVLVKALSENPALFVDMLRVVFSPSEESGIVDPEPENREHPEILANQAYRLLDLWDRLPGARDDGSIDGVALETWIKQARVLAKQVGREEIADSRIGQMLSASPMGADGNWPAEAVREVIDLFRSKEMAEGFWVGKHNRRGPTMRDPRDGGQLERDEAEKYRRWAAALVEYPHTARALNTMADSYELEARRHDEQAERRDWER